MCAGMCGRKCLYIRWHQISGVGIIHNYGPPDGKSFNFNNVLNKIKKCKMRILASHFLH